jgi:transposase InsO family protein
MMYPLVRDLAAPDARIRVPVAVTCRVLKIGRQPYYRWLKNPVSATELTEAYRANVLFDAHRADPEFGYRFLTDGAADAGEVMAARTAWRICSRNGWWAAFSKPARPKARKAGPPVHDDRCATVGDDGRIKHVFAAEAPNKLWVTDITEHPTGEGKLYLCGIKDMYSNRLVGYSINSTMKDKLAVKALSNAVMWRRRAGQYPTGCVIHSDRGSQFRSHRFVKEIARHGMIGSMGRVGACGDNAAMESFFALLQKNVLDRQEWATREELRIAIVDWIERTYHRRRRQVRLNHSTPIDYETTMTPPADQAA